MSQTRTDANNSLHADENNSFDEIVAVSETDDRISIYKKISIHHETVNRD